MRVYSVGSEEYNQKMGESCGLKPVKIDLTPICRGEMGWTTYCSRFSPSCSEYLKTCPYAREKIDSGLLIAENLELKLLS